MIWWWQAWLTLQCAMLLFIQSNSKAHARSVAHKTSFDYSVENQHAYLASVLNQMSIIYSMLLNCVEFVMTDSSVIANKQQSGNAPKHESRQAPEVANLKNNVVWLIRVLFLSSFWYTSTTVCWRLCNVCFSYAENSVAIVW